MKIDFFSQSNHIDLEFLFFCMYHWIVGICLNILNHKDHKIIFQYNDFVLSAPMHSYIPYEENIIMYLTDIGSIL